MPRVFAVSAAIAEIHRLPPFEHPALLSRVLDVLDVARTPAEVAGMIGVSADDVAHAIADLLDAGLICAVAGGRWRA